mgnify:FL=1|jgi:hypothetical protein|tara:strand:+ start:407 stop:706 length:300 start_codon:yes stop_codon:yes gene_type:complete
MNKPQFDPKELLNSKRIFKSATPKGDISWYVKWISSFIIVTAMSLRGIEGMQFYDLILSMTGVAGWLWVGMLWKDRALIILNAVGLVILFKNLLTEFIV